MAIYAHASKVNKYSASTVRVCVNGKVSINNRNNPKDIGSIPLQQFLFISIFLFFCSGLLFVFMLDDVVVCCGESSQVSDQPGSWKPRSPLLEPVLSSRSGGHNR